MGSLFNPEDNNSIRERIVNLAKYASGDTVILISEGLAFENDFKR
jgi:hypothetical protein